jgi:hypothetical protein
MPVQQQHRRPFAAVPDEDRGWSGPFLSSASAAGQGNPRRAYLAHMPRLSLMKVSPH